jgi:glycine/D-amino acid oxidase-like deaminating enzyme
MGDASLLGDRSTIAQVHPKMLCEAMWEHVQDLAPESKLVRGRVVSAVYDGDGDSSAPPYAVGAQLEDGSLVKGDSLLYACGPWTADNMYGTKYHSLVVPITKTLNQCVFFSGLGDPEVYVRNDSTAYCTGFPDPPIKVTEHPGEEEVRPDAIDKIRTSVESASSYSDGNSANFLVLSEDEGRAKALKQACYLPSTADGIPMMGKVNDRPNTYVAAGHTCWGILMGPASGEAMAHEIAMGKSPHVNLRLFSPERFGGSLKLVPPATER